MYTVTITFDIGKKRRGLMDILNAVTFTRSGSYRNAIKSRVTCEVDGERFKEWDENIDEYERRHPEAFKIRRNYP